VHSKILPPFYRRFTLKTLIRPVCLNKSEALSTALVAIILVVTRFLAYTSAYRGWSPPYNRHGQADDSYADRLLKKSASGVLPRSEAQRIKNVRLASSLAAALLDGLFQQPVLIAA